MRRIRIPARVLFRFATSSHRLRPLFRFASSEAAKYERKSPVEHVLLRPDTYIGGVGIRETETCWILNSEDVGGGGRVEPKQVTYPPGLLKIFDEILVNAADNKARDAKMNRLEVTVDRKTARISVWNNGRGIPVELHPTEGVYVPTMVFGSLFTSSNYDDNEIKVVGGRNGYGAKLCNIFSTEFVVETVDSKRGRRFRQKWYNNMKSSEEAVVEQLSPCIDDFTKVEFIPDLSRFHVDHLTDGVIDLIEKRVVEVAATLPRGVDVFLNGARVQIDGFEDYVRKFDHTEDSFLFLHPSPRWHVAIGKRNDDQRLPNVVSFVNNINTEKGGSHVDYVTDKIVSVVKKLADTRLKGEKSAKPAMIRAKLAIFINCLIENPSFESQTKETLTTRPRQFGSSFEMDLKKVTEWAESSGIIDDVVDEILNLNAKKKLSSAVKRGGVQSVRDIVKLEDAAWAGVPGKAKECTLILTEGDSAKALALSGLEVLGRQTYGVFPLKGKLTNVSNLDESRAAKNEEIANLTRILGLQFSVPDPPIDSLRYGKLLILADQDEDGSHIKGLIINFIHRFWPSLVRNDGFIHSFRTPLLKVKLGKERGGQKAFFSMAEYEKWAESREDTGKVHVKYYKGLGTSTSSEAREYFGDLQHHIVNFKYADTKDDDALRMAFDRDKAEQRKQWIRDSEAEKTSSEDVEEPNDISYRQFVDKELMRFGMVDLRRSIPCLVDGLKPSQRKILWTMLKMEQNKEIMSQLAGAVAQSQSYHHGEESLVRTIVRMGQTFCGAANLPLLQPIGQFGTRHEGGHDAASARYIFTALAPTTRLLFPSADDRLLRIQTEDGQLVEPTWLCPVVPLILINGTEGIGTGWSTRIANRSMQNVIDSVRWAIDKATGISSTPQPTLPPFYEDFHGKIDIAGQIDNPHQFSSSGIAQWQRNGRKNSAQVAVEILELPVGVWTSKYKEKLMRILDTLPLIDFSELHTEKRVHFRMTFDRKKLDPKIAAKSRHELLNFLKLRNTVTENLVLFDENGRLREFRNVADIAKSFFEVRRAVYGRRIEAQTEESRQKLDYVWNQIKFIDSVTSGSIELGKLQREELEGKMLEMGFQTDPMRGRSGRSDGKTDFAYLLQMPLSRLTSDEISRLADRQKQLEAALEAAKSAEWHATWHSDLDKLAAGVRKFNNN